jgi:hypothetical protein
MPDPDDREREFRQVGGHRVIEFDFPLFDQLQHGRCRERFRGGGRLEAGGVGVGRFGGHVGVAERLPVDDFTVPGYQHVAVEISLPVEPGEQ